MNPRILLTSCALLAAVAAREGRAHGDEPRASAPVASVADVTASPDRPMRLRNGEWFIPKPVQRLLGIRTQPLPGDAAASVEELQGEVIASPESDGLVSAPQAGVLEPGPGGWPQAGMQVKAGQVLAYVRPRMTGRDAARRHVQLAEYEQRLGIAQINVDRLRLQVSATATGQELGNVYYEQALTELDAAQRQRDLLAASLKDRLPLRARTDGSLQTTERRSGDAVAVGDAVFEIADPAHLGVAAQAFDPRLGERLRSATLAGAADGTHSLRFRGQELATDQPGWRLLFDLADPGSGLLPGMPVRLHVETTDGGQVQHLAKACVSGTTPMIWVHTAPERFVARTIESCSSAAIARAADAKEFKEGERVVIAGAALLAQYSP